MIIFWTADRRFPDGSKPDVRFWQIVLKTADAFLHAAT
jgi:hypothetical protein